MAKLNKNVVYYSNMHLLLDQSPSSAASVVLFRPKIPSFGKFCKKDFFGTSLFSVTIIWSNITEYPRKYSWVYGNFPTVERIASKNLKKDKRNSFYFICRVCIADLCDKIDRFRIEFCGGFFLSGTQNVSHESI